MDDNQLYPVLLDLRGKRVVVIGAGAVAARKIAGLLETPAKVLVVGPAADARIGRWAKEGRLTHRAVKFEESDLQGATLVFAATDDSALNARIAKLAASRAIPANVATGPDGGGFTLPAQLRRGHLGISISTDGRCPALSRAVRRRLEEQFGPGWGPAVELLEEARGVVRQRVPDVRRRRDIMARLAERDWAAEIDGAGLEAARQALQELLDEEVG